MARTASARTLECRSFILNSESEAQVFTTNQQPDSDHLVIWENAGASHIGSTAGDNRFGLPGDPLPGLLRPRPARRLAPPAALARGRRHRHPHSPGWNGRSDGRLARDEHGNAVGGIRWPHVAVPLGTHRAEPPSEGRADLMGSTTAFDPEKVRRLYGTLEQYQKRFADAVDELVATGVVLPEDADSVRDPLKSAAWE